jgi:zinc/manganese transport system permease protein
MSIVHAVFAPGFFSNGPVQAALVMGAVVAAVCAPVGVLAVLRGQSFAGHAFADITSTGGSAAVLLGISPVLGFAASAAAGAASMEGLGARQHGDRDLVTGTVLGGALGLSALLLYLSTTRQGTSGATVSVLFGSVFAVSSANWPWVAALGLPALALVAAAYRPLLLSSVSPELAAARGVRSHLVGAMYLAALAASVALAALTIGAVLSTALLVGPAAAALGLSSRPGRAMAWAGAIGVTSVWAGIVLAYDSYSWPPAGRGWPVSFFVVALVMAFYAASRAGAHRHGRSPAGKAA